MIKAPRSLQIGIIAAALAAFAATLQQTLADGWQRDDWTLVVGGLLTAALMLFRDSDSDGTPDMVDPTPRGFALGEALAALVPIAFVLGLALYATGCGALSYQPLGFGGAHIEGDVGVRGASAWDEKGRQAGSLDVSGTLDASADVWVQLLPGWFVPVSTSLKLYGAASSEDEDGASALFCVRVMLKPQCVELDAEAE